VKINFLLTTPIVHFHLFEVYVFIHVSVCIFAKYVSRY